MTGTLAKYRRNSACVAFSIASRLGRSLSMRCSGEMSSSVFDSGGGGFLHVSSTKKLSGLPGNPLMLFNDANVDSFSDDAWQWRHVRPKPSLRSGNGGL